jgi:hypothetical protein
MGRYCELMTKLIDKGVGDEVWTISEDMLNKLARKDPMMFDEYIDKLEHLAYRIPKEEAERIVRAMRPKGQYWSYTQVYDLVKSKGVTGDWVNWYLVMNMVYNDFCATAKHFGLQNDVEFFYHLAKDFIEDPDAKPMKVEKYFLD